jgi:colanic acid biosynthesis glycosyl transferase WcaI
MRLLVITQYFWPEEFRINELVVELVSRGHEVTVLTGKPNYPAGAVFPEFKASPQKFSEYHGVAILRVPIVPRGRNPLSLLFNYISYPLSATLAGLWRLRRQRFDAVFVFEPSPPTVGIPAVALRALRGWPVAFWVLDQWPETLSAVGALKSKAALRLVGRLMSMLYRRCDLILVSSKSLVARVHEYGGKARRVRYFPNWVEGNYSLAGDVMPATEVPAKAGTFNVLFAGNIGESQDFPAILDAAEALRDDDRIRWLIVGDGRRLPWVRGEIARRGLTEAVLLLGRHPKERMPSFYRHAQALLVSLKAEPIFALTVPGKLQSYMAFGLPVLAMLDGAGTAIVEEARAGLTGAAGDAARLADNVRRLAGMSPDERAAMGHRGAEYAAKEFGRDGLIDRLEIWLDGMIRADGARA